MVFVANLILPNFSEKGKIEGIEELADYSQWILWREEKRSDEVTKIPQQLHGHMAKVNDETTWAALDELLFNIDWENENYFNGLGFVFTEEGPFCGVDLDDCRNPETGEVESWAEEIIEILDSYTEISPSGTGLHIIVKAELPEWARNKLKTEKYEIEIYDKNRYFTVTGQVQDFPQKIREAQEEIEEIQNKYWPTSAGEKHEKEGLDFEVDDLKLDETVDAPAKIEALKEKSEKFKLSWEHERDDLNDTSSSGYDLSLATIAAKASWEAQEIADLLIAHRKKHRVDLKLRQDYYKRTIEKAKRAAVDLDKAAAIDPGSVDDNLRQKILKIVSKQLGVKIKRFVKFTSDPPQFKVETAAGDALLGDGQAILRQRTFRGKILNATDKVISHHEKEDFENILQALLNAVKKLEIGDETTNAGAVRVWLQSYFKQRNSFKWEDREERQDFLESQSFTKSRFEKDGDIYIFLTDFRKWLKINEMEKISKKQLGIMLRAAGCEPEKIHYYKKDGTRTTLQAWRTPMEKPDIN